MIKKYSLLLFIALLPAALFAQTGKIVGKVVEKTNPKEGIMSVTVLANLNGVQKGGAATDVDGNFTISPLNPGSYDIEVKYIGYKTKILKGIAVSAEKTTTLKLEIEEDVTEVGEVVIETYKVPVINKDNTTTGGTMEAKDIAKMPTRSVSSMVQTQAAVSSQDDDKGLSFKGNRESANQTFVNGVKVIGRTPNLPPSAISEVNIMTGGVPSQYGDVVGGVTSITTKGPSSTYFGGIEYETSKGLLNTEGYDLLGFNLSGPLWTKSLGDTAHPELKKPILGFFLAGQYNRVLDSRVKAQGVWVASDSLEEALKTTPAIFVGTEEQGAYLPATQNITMKDLKLVGRSPNSGLNDVSFNTFIDFQPVDNLTIAVGANFNYTHNRSFNITRALLNSDNHTQRDRINWNVFGRVTQNFKMKESSNIKNLFYQIQADYSYTFDRFMDHNNKENFWRYAYYGKYDTQYKDIRIDTIGGGYRGKDLYIDLYGTDSLSFTAAEYNQYGASYNEYVLNALKDRKISVTGPYDYLQYGGLLNGMIPEDIYGIYENPGRPQFGFTKDEERQFRLTALTQAQIKSHALKFGFEFEQRKETNYTSAPGNLWLYARGNMNNHLTEVLDTNDIVINPDGVSATWNSRTVMDLSQQTSFDKKFREKFGIANDQYVNIDSYSPDDLSLELFSANDLLYNVPYFSKFGTPYSGYDYTGKKSTAKSIAFRDFFSDTINRPIAPFNPIYMAGFIEDKFQIDDLILRLGLRVDRYDANQQVLKDPYSFVNLVKVGDVEDMSKFNGGNFVKPENIGDDYAIYVDKALSATGENDPNNFTVVGFRKGYQWYGADGKELPNSNHVIGGTGTANPWTDVNSSINEDALNKTTWTNYKLTLDAFQDYKPQINVMPRISFSFPVSEDALFFAHYDILTQRPEANYASAYLYTNVTAGGGVTLPNANLKPTKKIDYQLGFQQKLSSSSAFTLSAFYSELRDQVQIVKLNAAFPVTYSTYGNIDFGNVKGMTFQYDLRRTRNIRITSSYTLQFANGTGSDATSNASFSNQTQQFFRVPVPLDFDQRHNIKFNFDYRYSQGEGPVWGKVRPFENAGANFTIYAGSGFPYSAQRNVVANFIGANNTPQIEGQINGARKPWNIRANLRLDKDIKIKLSKKEGAEPYMLNVYMYIQNLFNQKNIIDIYRYTGSAKDDGYLSSGQNQSLNQSLIDLYTIRMLSGTDNGVNYSIPRRIRLGVSFSF